MGDDIGREKLQSKGEGQERLGRMFGIPVEETDLAEEDSRLGRAGGEELGNLKPKAATPWAGGLASVPLGILGSPIVRGFGLPWPQF